MPTLSLVVIACDEERDLPRCLDSVPFAAERIVVDSGSRDATRERAQERGARVVEQAWLGFGKQKAFAFAQAQSEWILNLDADEALSPELAREIPAALERAEVAGYELPYRTEFLGRTLRFGGLGGERHLRLFRRAQGRMAERALHEGVEVAGRVERLRGAVMHRSYADVAEYLQKLDRYTALAAQQRFEAGKRPSPVAPLKVPWAFLRRYVLQLGLLDGYAGYVNASLSALYELTREAKLRELWARSP